MYTSEGTNSAIFEEHPWILSHPVDVIDDSSQQPCIIAGLRPPQGLMPTSQILLHSSRIAGGNRLHDGPHRWTVDDLSVNRAGYLFRPVSKDCEDSPG